MEPVKNTVDPTEKTTLEINDCDALLSKLWTQPEGRKIDFKAPFIFGKTLKKEMYGLVKDILAMANTEGGGYIVVGRDDAGKAVDCSAEILASFDPTKVHAQTKKYGRPEPKFTIDKARSPEGTFAIIIRVEEFEEHLLICAENADCESNKLVLRAGAVYIRSTTGDASSTHITTEQDMRNLITRSLLKSRQHLSKIFERGISSVLNSPKSNMPNNDDLNWQKEEMQLANKLDSEISLNDHLLQIIAHPVAYDKGHLSNVNTIKNKLTDSVQQHRGWSFPCPDFELDDLQLERNAHELIGRSSRGLSDGELRSVFGLSVSGLIIYRDELCSAYDSMSHEKPLLILWPLLTIYRAVAFLGRFFAFSNEHEKFKLKILITDTNKRLPARCMTTSYLPDPFYNAPLLSTPKISVDLELTRDEISLTPVEAFYRIVKLLIAQMRIPMSDDELLLKVNEIASSK